MKNYFLILSILGLSFMSCKKNRVCNCTITTIGSTKTTTSSEILAIDTTIVTPLYTTNTVNSTFRKVSKRKAKTNCFDKDENIDETTNNSIPGFFTITNNNSGVRSYDCELK